jgi:hypothetical protein
MELLRRIDDVWGRRCDQLVDGIVVALKDVPCFSPIDPAHLRGFAEAIAAVARAVHKNDGVDDQMLHDLKRTVVALCRDGIRLVEMHDALDQWALVGPHLIGRLYLGVDIVSLADLAAIDRAQDRVHALLSLLRMTTATEACSDPAGDETAGGETAQLIDYLLAEADVSPAVRAGLTALGYPVDDAGWGLFAIRPKQGTEPAVLEEAARRIAEGLPQAEVSSPRGDRIQRHVVVVVATDSAALTWDDQVRAAEDIAAECGVIAVPALAGELKDLHASYEALRPSLVFVGTLPRATDPVRREWYAQAAAVPRLKQVRRFDEVLGPLVRSQFSAELFPLLDALMVHETEEEAAEYCGIPPQMMSTRLQQINDVTGYDWGYPPDQHALRNANLYRWLAAVRSM